MHNISLKQSQKNLTCIFTYIYIDDRKKVFKKIKIHISYSKIP